MLTREQINGFGEMLDMEYESTIKPILKESRENLIKLFHPVLCKEYNEMCDRNRFNHFKYGYVPSDVWALIRTLGANECVGDVYFNNVSDGLVSFCGYSPSAYEGQSILNILNHASGISSDDAKAVQFITDIKKRFELIKSCYFRMFAENDGAMVKKLVDAISICYNNVKNKDDESDNELFAMFGVKPKAKSFKVTITIEST